jgi:hypothetical protein
MKNIPEVDDFFERGEVKALARDKIKIGCAEFTYAEVDCYRYTSVPVLYHYKDMPHIVAPGDAIRLMKLMDAFVSSPPPPAPKFKIGDTVHCGLHLHNVTYVIGEVELLPDGTYAYGRKGFHSECGEHTLTLVAPVPTAIPPPKFNVGDRVCCKCDGEWMVADRRYYGGGEMPRKAMWTYLSGTDSSFYRQAGIKQCFLHAEENLTLVKAAEASAPPQPEPFTGGNWTVLGERVKRSGEAYCDTSATLELRDEVLKLRREVAELKRGAK